jgi:NADH-quinone oxidoreductase subunit L
MGLPWLGAIAVWLAGDQRPKVQNALAVGFSVAAGITGLALIPLATDTVELALPLGGLFGVFTFIPDGMGVFLAVVATVVGSLAVVFSVDYMRGEAQLGRYYMLVLLFIGAMVGLVLTGSLMLLFFFWEMVALCSYALISFYNDDPKTVAGGIKALVITQLGGIGLLAGVLVAYSYLGTYQITALLAEAETLPATALAVIGFSFIIAAAAKSAQFPFQTWLPDAMEAPTPVSALIHAATMVNAGVYLLARFYPAFHNVPGWGTSIVIIGMLSALLAAMMAMVSNDLKRVLAFSTVSQLGYMFYAIGVGAVFASMFHLLSHAVFKALLFLAAGAVIHAVGTRDMRQMGALSKVMPYVRNTFIIGALALAGIPFFFNGFWSKELILEGGLLYGPLWGYLVMLLVAGLTAFYTFRMVWMVFFGKKNYSSHPHDAPPAMKISLGLLALGTLSTWLVVGQFGQMLVDSLPYHHLHALGLSEMALEVLLALATAFALGVVALGLAAWWWRDKLTGLGNALQPIANIARNDFGFEWLNSQIVKLTQTLAEASRTTQTGQLNWNVAGIVGGLVIVLSFIVWSL